MPTQSSSFGSTFIIAHLLAATVAQAQDAEALSLPKEQSIVDSLTRAGTVQWSGLAGLSRMEFTDVDETYYVIDQVGALRGWISEALANVWRNDSDLSIRYDLLGGEFIHLRLADDGPEVRYFRFENWLQIQLSEFFESGAHANDGGSVEFLEYRIPIEAARKSARTLVEWKRLWRSQWVASVIGLRKLRSRRLSLTAPITS